MVGYRTVSVDVDVELNDFDDDDLIDELQDRGYVVGNQILDFTREEVLFLEELIEKLPYSPLVRNIQDKLKGKA